MWAVLDLRINKRVAYFVDEDDAEFFCNEVKKFNPQFRFSIKFEDSGCW